MQLLINNFIDRFYLKASVLGHTLSLDSSTSTNLDCFQTTSLKFPSLVICLCLPHFASDAALQRSIFSFAYLYHSYILWVRCFLALREVCIDAGRQLVCSSSTSVRQTLLD